LHFCADQVRWECSSFVASEAFPNGAPNAQAFDRSDTDPWLLKLLSDGNGEPLYRKWATISEIYSEKSLSFQSDKLNALSGLAHYFTTSLGCKEGRLILLVCLDHT
jgi:hypothetical protein